MTAVDPATEVQAYALLLAVIEREGDLLAAFAVLCAQVRPGDLTGDTFETALARAVKRLLVGPRPIALAPPTIEGEILDA